MGTATILGDTYSTATMPDGLEWCLSDLVWNGAGRSVPGGLGRVYSQTTARTFSVAGGWRLPTKAEYLAFLVAAGYPEGAPDVYYGAGALKSSSSSYWNAPNSGATNALGFGVIGSGYYSGGNFFLQKSEARHWTATQIADVAGKSANAAVQWQRDADYAISYFGLSDEEWSIRLVRDPVTDTPAESVQVEYDLAIDWTEAADGTPIAYDDGAVYDSIRSTITLRLLPAELTALEAAWEGDRLWSIYGTGFLLGPTVDHSGGVQVRLESFQVDGPADSSMSLFDATVTVLYGPLSTPSAGSLALVMSRGVPYHSTRPGSTAWLTDGGGSDVATYGGRSTRSTVWYSNSLSTAQAADVVDALRTLRGSSMAWTATGLSRPFGPDESQTSTVWIPRWRVFRGSNLTWDIEMEVVRDG